MADIPVRLGGLSALLLAVLGVTAPAGAGTTPLAVTAPGTASVLVGSSMVIPGGSVTGFAGEPVRVIISVGSGTLSVPADLAGVTVPFEYPALGAEGATLAVEGQQDAVNGALQELRWTPSTQGATDVTVEAGPGGAAFDPSTGHYYRVLTSDAAIAWDDAKIAAEASSFEGEPGYLATIVSQDEQALLAQTTPGTVWLGGAATAPGGPWQWVTGPESGTVFWDPSCGIGFQGSCASGLAMWGAGEPSVAPAAHVAALGGTGGGGLWAAEAADTPSIDSYLVEYGGAPGDTSPRFGRANSTLTAISPPSAPTILSATSGTDASTVAWQAPASDGASALLGYVVAGLPAGWCSVPSTATSCVVPDLVPGISYTFQVAAVNAAGLGGWSAPSAAVTPRYATTVRLASSASGAAPVGVPIELTAAVDPSREAPADPSGQITFMDGWNVLGSASAASAQIVVADLAAGTHQLSAHYSGDASFGSSTSDPLSLVIVAASSTSPEPAPGTSPPTDSPTSPEPSDTTSPPTQTSIATATTSATSRVETSTTAATDTTAGTDAAGPTGAVAGPAGLYVVFDVGVGVDVTAARFTVRGKYLRPGSAVRITAHSDPVVLATVEVGAAGSITWDGVLPAGLADGDHAIVADGVGADGSTVERSTSFGVAAGRLVRTGASTMRVTPTTVTPTSTPAASSVVDGATGGTPAGRGGPPLVVLLFLPVAGIGAALWVRSRKARLAAGSTSRAPEQQTAGPEDSDDKPDRRTPADGGRAPSGRARLASPRRHARRRPARL